MKPKVEADFLSLEASLKKIVKAEVEEKVRFLIFPAMNAVDKSDKVTFNDQTFLITNVLAEVSTAMVDCLMPAAFEEKVKILVKGKTL